MTLGFFAFFASAGLSSIDLGSMGLGSGNLAPTGFCSGNLVSAGFIISDFGATSLCSSSLTLSIAAKCAVGFSLFGTG